MTGQTYKIFISSPSDVRPERAIAGRVVAKLAREFTHHCAISAILWEREPLVATRHFQDPLNIPTPSSADICVVVLWSRLGFLLPPDQFRGAISGRPVTGTEWEFEDALKSFQDRDLPDLLVYQKTAPVIADLSAKELFEERRDQHRLVTDFISRWFMSADGGSLVAASHLFATLAQFEERLEEHLRALLLRRLERDLGPALESGAITWTEPPWPALASFEVEQAPIFFGRTRARNELRELLAARAGTRNAFVLVLGASGSGKSSLVKAGLLPDLMLPGMIGDVGLVRYGILRPSDAGSDTLRALAAAMLSTTALPELATLDYTVDNLATQLRENPRQAGFAVKQGLGQAAAGLLTERGQTRLVLVADQLEELFSMGPITAAERAAFVDTLAALARSSLVWVVATMRADFFFDRLDQLPALGELSEGGRYLLLSPRRAELVEIVRRPARAAGLSFEVNAATGEGLDEAIVDAAARDPGALPLLSFALDRLWRQPRAGVELTFGAYAQLGELEGAIAQHAEGVVAGLSPAAQAVLPGLLLGLVGLRDSDQLATSRPARRQELAGSAAAEQTIERLIEARMLIADETPQGIMLRLTHEALVRNWPRLASLIEDSREELAAVARMRVDLTQWEQNDKRADLLLPPGKRLSEGMELLARRPDELGYGLTVFINASSRRATAVVRRQTRLVGAAVAILALLAVTSGIGAWLGFSGQRVAQHEFDAAEAHRSESLVLALKKEEDPKVSEAVLLDWLPADLRTKRARLRYSEAIDHLLLAATTDRERLVLSAGKTLTEACCDGEDITNAAFSPDGSRISATSWDGLAQIFDATNGMLLKTIASNAFHYAGGGITLVADERDVFSPNGRLIATITSDNGVEIWDVDSGALRSILKGHVGLVVSANFSPDSLRVVTASEDSTARIWDASSGALLEILKGHSKTVNNAEYSPDGQSIVTSSDDGKVQIWDSKTGELKKVLTEGEPPASSAEFSPDGTLVMAALNDTVRVWNTATAAVFLTIKTGSSPSAVFCPDGRRIAIAAGGKLRFASPITGKILSVVPVDVGSLSNGSFDSSCQSVLTTVDGIPKVLTIPQNVILLVGNGPADGEIHDAAFSPNGQRILTTSAGGTIGVWNTVDGSNLLLINRPLISWVRNGYSRVFFSPDGQQLIGIQGWKSDHMSFGMWDAKTGSLTRDMSYSDLLRPDTIASILPDNWEGWISRKGNRIVVSFGRTQVLNGATYSLLSTYQGDGHLRSSNFSPDGLRIVSTAVDNNTAIVWDAIFGAKLMTLQGHCEPLTNAVYSPDGRYILTASADGTARVWNAASGGLLRILVDNNDSVVDAEFSPDGGRIVTASDDGTVATWDTATGRQLTVLSAFHSAAQTASFSPDGRHVVTSSYDGTALVWDVPDDLKTGDVSFVRAINSLSLSDSLRSRYGLPTPSPPQALVTAPGCSDPLDPAVSDNETPAVVAAWTRGAQAGAPACDQRLAAYFERGDPPPSELAPAFFYHALAARLLEEQGQADDAQHERYRREDLAWLLPRQQVEALMDAADAWKPGRPLGPRIGE